MFGQSFTVSCKVWMLLVDNEFWAWWGWVPRIWCAITTYGTSSSSPPPPPPPRSPPWFEFFVIFDFFTPWYWKRSLKISLAVKLAAAESTKVSFVNFVNSSPNGLSTCFPGGLQHCRKRRDEILWQPPKMFKGKFRKKVPACVGFLS